MALSRQSVENGVVSRIEDPIGGWVAGYRSASSFSVAFLRHVGLPPARHAQKVMEDAFA